MRSINRVFLLGNLGRDVELRFAQDAKPIATFNVATHYSKKQPDGSWEELTDWHRVKVFGHQAEACAKHLTKGSGVLVEGRIEVRSYDDDQGNKRYITEVIAREVCFTSRAGVPREMAAEPMAAEPMAAEPMAADVPF